MMAKPMKTLELHYPMIQFIVTWQTDVGETWIPCQDSGLSIKDWFCHVMHKGASRRLEVENSNKETKSWPYKTTKNLQTPSPWSIRVSAIALARSLQDLVCVSKFLCCRVTRSKEANGNEIISFFELQDNSHAMWSIHLFSPLLKGDQFYASLTARAQNVIPINFVSF